MPAGGIKLTFCDLMISVNEVPTTAHLILVEVFKEENPIELGIQDRGGGDADDKCIQRCDTFLRECRD